MTIGTDYKSVVSAMNTAEWKGAQLYMLMNPYMCLGRFLFLKNRQSSGSWHHFFVGQLRTTMHYYIWRYVLKICHILRMSKQWPSNIKPYILQQTYRSKGRQPRCFSDHSIDIDLTANNTWVKASLCCGTSLLSITDMSTLSLVNHT